MERPATNEAEGSTKFLSQAVHVRIVTIPGREER